MIVKKFPEDFQVREVMELEICEGDYSYYLLRKKNWNTLDIVEKLEKKLHTKIGFAGNKDKHAVTEQYISIFKASQSKISKIKIADVSLEFIGKGNRPISLGMLQGNQFAITLRDV